MEYLKINETEFHTLDKIEAIIRRCDPSILVLESEKPSVNNRVLRHARYLTRNGWIKEDIDVITKYKRTKDKVNELNMISITLEKGVKR